MHTIYELANAAGGQLIGNPTLKVQNLYFDSRKLFAPEGAMFVAIKGSGQNGHRFISSLYDKGVLCYVVNKKEAVDYFRFPNASFIEVDNTIWALQAIAAYHRSFFSGKVVAITGSNGKTIVKEWLGQIVEETYVTVRSPRSYNSQLGVPLSVWMLNENAELGIFEAGISLPGEMQSIANVIQPEIGIFTNIGDPHQENFESLEQKLHEKFNLYEGVKVVLMASKQKLVCDAFKKRFPNKRVFTVGNEGDDALRLLSCKIIGESSTAELSWKDHVLKVCFPFTDVISIDNGMLAMLSALYLGVDETEVVRKIEALQPVAMRLEQKEGINNCLLIDDAYNSDISSLSIALDHLNQMGARKGLRKTLILSDIFQSGLSQDELFFKVQALVKEKEVDRLIGIGPVLYQMMDAGEAYPSTDAFLKHFKISAFKDEAILLKGSRAFSLERISSLLELQRHKTVMEVDLNALANNVQYYKSLVKPHTKLLAMVKAFSYGSGAFEIANFLQHHKVDYLGVAFADEGIELREAGISLPIIVMNPEISSFQLMLDYDLEPEIYSFEVLDAFFQTTKRYGLSDVPVHIKLDSGMHRLGFLPDQIDDLIGVLAKQSVLKVSSVFSHLAGTDEAIHDEFTNQQITLFTQMSERLEKGLQVNFLRHILNSAGVQRFTDAKFDMVRLGIGMYGIGESKQLMPVAKLKSYISQVKKVAKGETVGYSRVGKVDQDMVIAIVPIGYADGLDRRLSNGVGQFYINGAIVPIIGNVCMDMCMVNVTGIQVSEGDEVEVFGDHCSIVQMAEAMGTIPYEVLTGISRRVKRIYSYE